MHFIYEYSWLWIVNVIAIVHAFKTGRNNYLYLLLFLPVIGPLIYFWVEVLPTLQGKSGFLDDTLFNTRGSIPELEKQLRISDTFTNRTYLANAYAARQQYDDAIKLYQSALVGHHQDDVETNLQIARVYFLKNDFEKCTTAYEKCLQINKGKFIRPDDEFWYALSLYKIGKLNEAEASLKNHIRFHKTFDSMYYYGELLVGQGRKDEARQQFETIIDQRDLMPKHLRSAHAQYVRMAKRALSGLR
jgi:hypothetical protein